ncbi:MAG: hypothetical protein A4E65_02577 [Syntrophorhabdus sp. PtaU1.Bin153]|nr:MAG: hypothetical protein A4E65_02577 [Syntrophorhabdus sp. PtaU1.Bin153]
MTVVTDLIEEYHKLEAENKQLMTLIENLLEQGLASSSFWRTRYMALASSGLMAGREQDGCNRHRNLMHEDPKQSP